MRWLVLCVHGPNSYISINITLRQTHFRHRISNSTLDNNRRDAIFDDLINKDLDCKNFDRSESVGIVTEQGIKDNQNPILASSDGDYKKGFNCLVYC